VHLFSEPDRGLSQVTASCHGDSGKWGYASRPPYEGACVAARIDPLANFRCLRHTYASLTIMNGAPLMVVLKTSAIPTRAWSRSIMGISLHPIRRRNPAAAPRFGNPSRRESDGDCGSRQVSENAAAAAAEVASAAYADDGETLRHLCNASDRRGLSV